jgi:hypothetical protein
MPAEEISIKGQSFKFSEVNIVNYFNMAILAILKSQLLRLLIIVLGTILLIYQLMMSPNYHGQVNPKAKAILVVQTEVENLGVLHQAKGNSI